jgi:FixJ family two-component response regulator
MAEPSLRQDYGTSPIGEQEQRVYVIDDDDSMRSSLERLLSSEGLTVRTFSTGQAFLDALPQLEAPGCVVIDVGLPGLDGLALHRRLRELDAPLAVVFLTGRGSIPMSVEAIKAGAVEFFTKPFRPGELIAGVRNAIARERAAELERRALAELRRRHLSLTAREREVMAGVVEGLLNKQIAARLGTSEVTVKEQRGQVMRKMFAESAADLVRMGMKLGIFALETSFTQRKASQA